MAETLIDADALGVAYRRYTYRPFTLKDAVTSFFRSSRYESFWALRNATFSIARGEVLGVIGANGSGKSTLLKAICGVLPPTEGSVRVRGRIAPLIELGGGFNPELTGRENVFLNGAILDMSRKEMESRYDGIVEFAGLHEFMDLPLRNYSSGMLVRLAFAIATEVDPDILLLDEVFAVGDESFRRKSLMRMDAYMKQARAVVIVSHSMHLIRTYCTHTILLDHGQILRAGDTEEVVAYYEQLADRGELGIRGRQADIPEAGATEPPARGEEAAS